MTELPKATYDPEADAIGVYFAPAGAVYDGSKEIAPNVMVDYDTEGRVIGVEILDVKRLLAERLIQAEGVDAVPSAAE